MMISDAVIREKCVPAAGASHLRLGTAAVIEPITGDFTTIMTRVVVISCLSFAAGVALLYVFWRALGRESRNATPVMGGRSIAALIVMIVALGAIAVTLMVLSGR
jgi:hypothetical protein